MIELKHLPTCCLLVLLATGTGAAAGERMEQGRKAYNARCASCHDTGTNNAPMTQQEADWKGRSHLWEGVLFEHAKQGYLGMPAGGGSDDIDDYQVEAAAEYMLSITHPDMKGDE